MARIKKWDKEMKKKLMYFFPKFFKETEKAHVKYQYLTDETSSLHSYMVEAIQEKNDKVNKKSK